MIELRNNKDGPGVLKVFPTFGLSLSVLVILTCLTDRISSFIQRIQLTKNLYCNTSSFK